MQANPNKGVSVNHDLKGLAKAQVTLQYKGRYVPMNMELDYLEIECEVYDADGILSVHAVCPKCRHAQWIDGRNKKIEYSASRGLFIEPFTCPWEMGGEDDHSEFGFGLCQLRLAYDGKIVKEA